MKYPDTKIVALCGGIGGSKLALGLNNVLDQKNLSIITNTGDDFLYLGFYICPDIDTVIYTLAGVNNKETGWGSSRFAQEGNALFGQWTWSGEGIKPLDLEKDKKHKVAKFKILKASVRAYQRNLNTHSSYKEFRKARAIQRDNDENLNSLELANYLDEYAETGEEYTKIIKKT